MTHTAWVSRRRRWHPDDDALVTGPGTAPSGLSSATAWFAVFSDPLRAPASTTTVAALTAAMRRLRRRNLQRVGDAPHGSSDTTAPSRRIRAKSSV
ncbi:hypothetical protein CMMCAS06_15860 [Clavibacter michiganensis subsp. michiganensis]|nr:hypothetical protein CMMCAS06_15860 [Clavibacter michiganensis subsp. michiganensis]